MIPSRFARCAVALVLVASMVLALPVAAFAEWQDGPAVANGTVPFKDPTLPDDSGPGKLGLGGFSVNALAPAYSTKWSTFGASSSLYGRPIFVSADNVGYVRVSDMNWEKVIQHSATGGWIRSIGTTGSGNAQFSDPYGSCIDRKGYLWVADHQNDRLCRFTSGGSWVGSVVCSQPFDVAAGNYGYLYVGCGDGLIRRFRDDGTTAGSTGGSGSADGQFNFPCSVAVDNNEDLYVADIWNNRVQVLDYNGSYSRKWGSAGSAAGQFQSPAGLDVDGRGRVWVTERDGARAQVFDSKGTHLATFGSLGAGNSQFTFPFGCGVDGTGFYVADANNQRVTKWTLGEAKTTERVGGADRYEVAVNLVKKQFPSYAGVRTVIITCGEDRAAADPLGAAQLVGATRGALMLTQSSTLNSRTKAALQSIRSANGPLTVYVLGGTVSVPAAVFNQIAAVNSGGTTTRISGADRYALSAAVAKRTDDILFFDPVRYVCLFNAEDTAGFYDALAASPMVARSHAVMMAVKKDSVPSSVSSALSTNFGSVPRYVVNSSRLSASTYTAVGASGYMTNSTDRYKAAADIASWGKGHRYTSWENVSIASKLPDALTGGAFIGMNDGVLLYCTPTSLPTNTSTSVTGSKSSIYKGWVFGGTVSVSDSVKSTFNSKFQ